MSGDMKAVYVIGTDVKRKRKEVSKLCFFIKNKSPNIHAKSFLYDIIGERNLICCDEEKDDEKAKFDGRR